MEVKRRWTVCQIFQNRMNKAPAQRNREVKLFPKLRLQEELFSCQSYIRNPEEIYAKLLPEFYQFFFIYLAFLHNIILWPNPKPVNETDQFNTSVTILPRIFRV